MSSFHWRASSIPSHFLLRKIGPDLPDRQLRPCVSLVTGSKRLLVFHFGNILLDPSEVTAHCSLAQPCTCNLCHRIYNLCSPVCQSIWPQSKCSLLSCSKGQCSRPDCLLPALRFLLRSHNLFIPGDWSILHFGSQAIFNHQLHFAAIKGWMNSVINWSNLNSEFEIVSESYTQITLHI